MSDIGENIAFKRNSGEELEINQEFVSLKARESNILIVNFRTDEDKINEVKTFFESLKTNEPFKFNIGDTGDIDCYFKGVSPLLEKNDDDSHYFFLSVTVQEIKSLAEQQDSLDHCGCC